LSADCRLTLTVRETHDPGEVEAAMALRRRVFCDEQGVSRELEFDGLDGDATQVVGLDESGVVATCRLRFLDQDCKLERMAVERRLRGQGAGAALLEACEAIAGERGAARMVLNAQTAAQRFYAGGGYVPEGETFVEANIEHVRMTKPLGAAGPP
jgi:predicted GNAT family N-acyltransferase